MNVYKNDKGRQIIREACRAIYSRWPVPAEEKIITTEDFGDTFCLDMGPRTAPPLILLHGSTSNSAAWMGYAPNWAEHFRVLAIDIPGQPGLSSDIRPPLADRSMKQWLNRVIEKLEIGSAFFCGMSLGSWIALEYAIDFSKKVRALCLLTTSGIVPPKTSFFLRILPLFFLGDWGARRINRIVYGPVPADPEAEKFVLLASRHYNPITEKPPLFSDENLTSLNFPLLYVGGTMDALINTRDTAARLSRLMPSAEIKILKDTGHVILDQGDMIRDFFISCSAYSS